MTNNIIQFLFISIIGTILHFTYKLSSSNKIIGIFSSKNESTWDHIKIALTPSFIFLILEIPFNNYCNFTFSKFIGIATLIISIPTLYYGYKFFLKREITLFNILIFYISIILSIIAEDYILSNFKYYYIINYISLISLIVIYTFYIIASFIRPKSTIFKIPN